MTTLIRTTKGIAIGVAVLALASASFAQQANIPPVHGTYYSAKDFERSPPWPLNPHPDLAVAEIAPGIFLIDDTGLPDTPEQAAARAAHQAAVEHAKALAASPALAEAERAARQAAQEAAWKANREKVSHWLHRDLRKSDGSAATISDHTGAARAQLLALAQVLAAEAEKDGAAVAQYLAAHRLPAATFGLPDGRIAALVRIEHGIPRVQVECNLEAAQTVGTHQLWPGGMTGLSLTGTNVVMAMWNGGRVREHGEFDFYIPSGARLTNMETYPGGYSFHATHVAGTLIASGSCADCCEPEDSPSAKGMSFQGRLLAWDYGDDMVEMTGATVTNDLRLSNHSYALQAGWGIFAGSSWWFGDIAVSTNEDYHFGFYTSEAQTLDEITHAAQTYLPVWAAANERSTNAGTGRPLTPPELGYTTRSNGIEIVSYDSRPDDGDPGGYDTLAEQAGAKNVLTVGAVHPITNGYAGPSSVIMSDFSSFGPTDDGRIKPDLVAAGVNILSLGNDNCGYERLSGTSMAAPSVCGSLGLILELHHRLHGTNQPMLASTLKGLAIHTADEAGDHPGPDYRFGWGLFNAQSAGLLVANNHASGSLAHIKEVRLTGGNDIEFPVESEGGEPLIVSVQWNDPPGTPPPASLDPTNLMLVNDLDLRVIAPNGATNYPWVLDPAAHTNAATTGDNVRDNVEQVAITNPAAGTYLVRVTHKGTNLVTGGPGETNEQWVSIFISGNAPQPAPGLEVSGISMVSSNEVALAWPAVVGRTYQVQHRDDVASGSWANSTGEISATKTNVAIAVTMPGGVTNRFFRVAQLR